MLVVRVTGPTATENSPFFPYSGGHNHRQGWPGRVNLSGLENTAMVDPPILFPVLTGFDVAWLCWWMWPMPFPLRQADYDFL